MVRSEQVRGLCSSRSVLQHKEEERSAVSQIISHSTDGGIRAREGEKVAAPPTAVAQWAGGMLFVPDIHLQPKPRVIIGPTLVIFGA